MAQALGLRGTAFTLDAACASSLYALKLAVDELRSGRADAMITGGVSRPDPLYTQMGFSQLRALSPRGKPSPFDEQGDGLIVGEGAGLFVLKRLDDAIRHGDEIHAVVRGIGLSNDIHGDLLAPSSEGQLRAMRAAYEQAGWSPRDVDLIECHATGTPVGDAVEVESLKALWAESRTGFDPGRGAVRARLGQVERRPHAHGGRRGGPAQAPAGPEAPGLASDRQSDPARAEARGSRAARSGSSPRPSRGTRASPDGRDGPRSAASGSAGSTPMC